MRATYHQHEQSPAFLRLDHPAASLQLMVPLKEIDRTLEIPEVEGAQLKGLNGGKSIRYLWQTTLPYLLCKVTGLAPVDADE